MMSKPGFILNADRRHQARLQALEERVGEFHTFTESVGQWVDEVEVFMTSVRLLIPELTERVEALEQDKEPHWRTYPPPDVAEPRSGKCKCVKPTTEYGLFCTVCGEPLYYDAPRPAGRGEGGG